MGCRKGVTAAVGSEPNPGVFGIFPSSPKHREEQSQLTADVLTAVAAPHTLRAPQSGSGETQTYTHHHSYEPHSRAAERRRRTQEIRREYRHLIA